MQRNMYGTLNSYFFQAQDFRSAVTSNKLLFIKTPSMTSNLLGGSVFGWGCSSGPKVAESSDYSKQRRDETV